MTQIVYYAFCSTSSQIIGLIHEQLTVLPPIIVASCNQRPMMQLWAALQEPLNQGSGTYGSFDGCIWLTDKSLVIKKNVSLDSFAHARISDSKAGLQSFQWEGGKHTRRCVYLPIYLSYLFMQLSIAEAAQIRQRHCSSGVAVFWYRNSGRCAHAQNKRPPNSLSWD